MKIKTLTLAVSMALTGNVFAADAVGTQPAADTAPTKAETQEVKTEPAKEAPQEVQAEKKAVETPAQDENPEASSDSAESPFLSVSEGWSARLNYGFGERYGAAEALPSIEVQKNIIDGLFVAFEVGDYSIADYHTGVEEVAGWMYTFRGGYWTDHTAVANLKIGYEHSIWSIFGGYASAGLGYAQTPADFKIDYCTNVQEMIQDNSTATCDTATMDNELFALRTKFVGAMEAGLSAEAYGVELRTGIKRVFSMSDPGAGSNLVNIGLGYRF